MQNKIYETLTLERLAPKIRKKIINYLVQEQEIEVQFRNCCSESDSCAFDHWITIYFIDQEEYALKKSYIIYQLMKIIRGEDYE